MFSARCGRSAKAAGESDRMLVRTQVASGQCFQSLHASISIRVGSHFFQLEAQLLLRHCQGQVRARWPGADSLDIERPRD